MSGTIVRLVLVPAIMVSAWFVLLHWMKHSESGSKDSTTGAGLLPSSGGLQTARPLWLQRLQEPCRCYPDQRDGPPHQNVLCILCGQRLQEKRAHG